MKGYANYSKFGNNNMGEKIFVTPIYPPLYTDFDS